MQTRKKLVEALNCVAKFHSYGLMCGRIVEKQLAVCGDSREINEDQALAALHCYIRDQRKMLKQAEAALTEIRKSAFEEAKEALLQGVGGG